MYTKEGDRGITALARSKNVSKSDDRLVLIGTIDELVSQLGMIKALLHDEDTTGILDRIQRTLLLAAEGISDPYMREYRIGDEHTRMLETCIDRLQLPDKDSTRPLPGGSVLSAEIDLARAVCRRAERALSLVSVRYGADNGAKKYLNRLSDYLYALARSRDRAAAEAAGRPGSQDGGADTVRSLSPAPGHDQTEMIRDAVVREILALSGQIEAITLRTAKQLIEIMEEEATRRGMAAVLAVCSPQGNPVAVHVMDGAYLVSYEAAVKKAYTSAAVRMSTLELSHLAQPGQTFYGVEHTDPRIVILGGGIPLMYKGKIIGGLGVSGGTSQEDHSLAEYGQSIVAKLL